VCLQCFFMGGGYCINSVESQHLNANDDQSYSHELKKH
jgi:hypothetical protein